MPANSRWDLIRRLRVNMFITASHPSSFNIHLILSSHLHLGFPSRPLPSGFRSETLYAFAMIALACSNHNITSNCVYCTLLQIFLLLTNVYHILSCSFGSTFFIVVLYGCMFCILLFNFVNYVFLL